jgi:hypothetical protein
MSTLKFAVLDELVYEAVRQYVHIWDTIRLELELITSIERAKCALVADEAAQDAVVEGALERAWERLDRVRAAEASSDDDSGSPAASYALRPPSADALARGVERAARAGARAAAAIDARRAGTVLGLQGT